MSNVYSSPEDFGLEEVTEVDWYDDSYGFDLTVVWRHKETGQLYWASDSGCSCPSPFEGYNGIEDLSTGTVHGILTELRERFELHPAPGDYGYSQYRHNHISAEYMKACTALMWL